MIRDLGFRSPRRRRAPVIVSQGDGGAGIACGDDDPIAEVVLGQADRRTGVDCKLGVEGISGELAARARGQIQTVS